MAKEPAQAAWSEPWKKESPDPPRGFAFAWFKIHGADVGIYSVHLKSNLIMHGDKEKEAAKNIRKREIAITQLVSHMHEVIEEKMPMVKTIVIGGDFNTNRDQPDFSEEKTLLTLSEMDSRVVSKTCRLLSASPIRARPFVILPSGTARWPCSDSWYPRREVT